MQRQGRQEMALRLRELGPVAAADYASAFHCYANQWLAWNGYATGFMFQPISPPAIA